MPDASSCRSCRPLSILCGQRLRAGRFRENECEARHDGRAGGRRCRDAPGRGAELPRKLLAVHAQATRRDAGWTSTFKLGCQLCHQIGSAITRARTRDQYDLGLRKSSYMNLTADHLRRDDLLNMLEDWSTRILAGETPPAPPRPSGIERNLVITQWAWATRSPTRTTRSPPTSADRLSIPTALCMRSIWDDRMLALDPITHEASAFTVPTLEDSTRPGASRPTQGAMVGGHEAIPMGFGSLGCPVEPGITGFTGRYHNPANPHNPMFDAQGRVWITTQVRRQWDEDLPQFCRDADGIRGRYHHRQLGYYDTESQRFELIDTCYGTHHLQFDEDGVLWLSGDSFVIGWFDPAKFDPTKPETLEAAQGWSEVRIDSDGDGEADTPIVGFNYGIIPNPATAASGLRNPVEIRAIPSITGAGWFDSDRRQETRDLRAAAPLGSARRGMWTPTASSGRPWEAADIWHASIAPGAGRPWGAGDQCPEGWTLYQSPGPSMQTRSGDRLGADFHYYLFVDQFDTLGLGKDNRDPQRHGIGLPARLRSGRGALHRDSYPVPAEHVHSWPGWQDRRPCCRLERARALVHQRR